MGELADKLRSKYLTIYPITSDLITTAARLESDLESALKRNAEITEIAEAFVAEYAENGWHMPSTVVDLPDRLANSRASTDYVHVRDRDALLAAVSEIVKCDMRAIRTVPVSALERSGGFTLIRLKSGEMTTDDLNRAAAVVVLEKRHDPNPELLERASTMLAERYIEEMKGGPK